MFTHLLVRKAKKFRRVFVQYWKSEKENEKEGKFYQ